MFKIKLKFSKLEQIYLANDAKLEGSVRVPGDKSISQRALIIGLISIGVTKIENILESEDVRHTLNAIKLLGGIINIKRNEIEIKGCGIGNMISPKEPIYMGNSGTGTRLLIGLVAGSRAIVTFYGDNSLSERPMDRVIKPLEKMGAKFLCARDEKLPITVVGARRKGLTLPIEYKLPMASAQVKSAIILAALTARGTSKILEMNRTRNNTEEMLANCGVDIKTKVNKNKCFLTELKGISHIKASNIKIPGDPSTAAFLAVAALLTKGSNVILENVYYDEFRLQIFKTLKKMGASIEIRKNKALNTCDINAKSSKLKNITIPASFSSSLIDEYPILSVAASCGLGKMTMQGLEELKFKESNRLEAIYKGLISCGVNTKIVKNNTLVVEGKENIEGGNLIDAKNDHRIAMSFNILSLVSKKPILVKGNNTVLTSFPRFFDILHSIGANVRRYEK